MSALGKTTVAEQLEKGAIIVSPILSPKQLGPSSIDLRMGTVVLMAKARGLACVDPEVGIDYRGSDSAHARAFRHQQRFERHELPIGRAFLLHPRALALVPTLEWVKLPPGIQGVVTARSSWAREGLNIATATIVNPGYIGTITLELSNLGPIPIKLYPGLRIAQIAFYSLAADLPRQLLEASLILRLNQRAEI